VREFKESVRVDRIEIKGVRWIAESKRTISPEAQAWHAMHERWLVLSEEIRCISNAVWRHWTFWHTAAGNDVAIRAYMHDLRLWNQTEKKDRVGDKPKCTVTLWPKEFASHLMQKLQADFPSVNARPLGLAVNKLMGTIKNGRGVSSAFPRSMQVLGDEVGPPSFCYAQPIPLCNARCKMVPPEDDKGDWQAEFRIDRIERDGAQAVSTCDTVSLKAKARPRATLEKLEKSKYHRNGGMLQYDRRKNAWFLMVGYRLPIIRSGALDETRTATVRAGIKCPLIVEIDGREIPVGGYGDNVAAIRAMIDRERQSRNENYRWSPGGSKGHGRETAQGQRMADFVNRWLRFCTNMNYTLTAKVIGLAQEHNCGGILFHQPTAETQGEYLLFSAGKSEQTRIASGWPWHRLAQIIQQKANQNGMETLVFQEKKVAQQPNSEGVATDAVESS